MSDDSVVGVNLDAVVACVLYLASGSEGPVSVVDASGEDLSDLTETAWTYCTVVLAAL